MADKQYITMGDAARALGLTKARISQLVVAGELESQLINGRKMISAESVDQRLKAPKHAGRPALSRSAVRFTLMMAEYEVAILLYDPQLDLPFGVEQIIDNTRMPFTTSISSKTPQRREFNDWWFHRSIPQTRPDLFMKLPELGVREAWELPMKNLGLSLSDCYWLRPDKREDISWGSINYFDNDFTGSHETTWDTWLSNIGLDSPDNTSEGELPKRWGIKDGERILIKGCLTDDQRPYNEIVASLLGSRILAQGEFVPYELVKLSDGPACACPNFLNKREEYIPAFYVNRSMGNVRGSSTYDRLCRYCAHWDIEEVTRSAFSKMIAFDSIIANTDRHWRNFGFVRNIDTLQMRPAPIFDSGNSLWFNKTPAQVAAKDWSFMAKPFEYDPDAQLALIDSAQWFSDEGLDGFAEAAVAILSQSSFAAQDSRLAYIEEGLNRRVQDVSAVLRVAALRK